MKMKQFYIIYVAYKKSKNIKMDALGITQQISNYIIRPPRASYSIEQLGQQKFEYKSTLYERIDFQVPKSPTNFLLECSLYTQAKKQGKQARPTVVFLHANSSSRVTIKNYLKNLIEKFDVVAFDFRGCGLSDGKFLTLGFLEKYDLKAVIQFVEAKFGTRKWMIWGRSMGAVTAILYTAKFQQFSDRIYALVLDSPFADLQKIIHFMADKKAPLVPSFMIQSIIENLQEHIKQKIKQEYGKQFLIRKHKPINQISKIKVPIFFIGSKNDEIVDCKHLSLLYDNAHCEKQMEVFEGGHNQVRPEHLKLAVVEFLVASLLIKRQGFIRRRIFQFTPKISKDNNVLSKSNPKDRLKSKSANKNRLFRLESLPTNNQNQKIKEEPKPQLPNKHKKQRNSLNQFSQQQRKQTERTHAEILNKVLPQNSSRRSNRIFGIPDKKQ